MKKIGSLLIIVLAAWMLTACAKKSVERQTQLESQPAMVEAPKVKTPEPLTEPTSSPAIDHQPLQNDNEMTLQEFLSDFVFFDFDQAVLRPDAVSVLQIKARWLKDHPDPKTFIIEGHCDERGTDAYNIALGERRAQAVKHYLVDSGLDANRFQIYSYGEERPLEAGHDESAWSRNRRATFAINE